MYLEISNYLKKKKPLMKIILKELLKEYKYVSILGEDSRGKQYSVDKNSVTLQDHWLKSRGFVIRCYKEGTYFEYAFTNLTDQEIPNILSEVKKLGDETVNRYNLRKYPEIKEESLSFSKAASIKINPEEVKTKDILDKMIGLKNEAFRKEKGLLDFNVNYNYKIINKIFISSKKDLEQAYINSMLYLIPVAQNENGIKQLYKSLSGAKGFEIFDEAEGKLSEGLKEIAEVLKARRLEPGEYEVICSPGITGLIAHESFGHGVEMDMFVKDRAKSKDYLGKEIASSIVTMIDGADAAIENGSYFFDDEGTVAGKTTIIKNGILQTGINDSLSAFSLNINRTGNGRRQSFDRKAYSRMTNTFFEKGNSSLAEMIKSIKYGFYLDSMNNGMEDPKNWGIQCMIDEAKEIKDGKFTGRVFSPILMTGYVPDLLKSITMVSNDLELSGTGYCGKGYKEFVVVSEGGPYIKCKCKLS